MNNIGLFIGYFSKFHNLLDLGGVLDAKIDSDLLAIRSCNVQLTVLTKWLANVKKWSALKVSLHSRYVLVLIMLLRFNSLHLILLILFRKK